jgi:hypothetical protein
MQWRASKRQCTGHCEAASRRCQCGPAPGFCVFGCCPPASRRTAAGAADGAAGRWQARSGGGRHFRRRRSCFWCAETGSGSEGGENGKYLPVITPPAEGEKQVATASAGGGRRAGAAAAAWRPGAGAVSLFCWGACHLWACAPAARAAHAATPYTVQLWFSMRAERADTLAAA